MKTPAPRPLGARRRRRGSPLQGMGGICPPPPQRRAPAPQLCPAAPRRYHAFMVPVVRSPADWSTSMIAARAVAGAGTPPAANVGRNPSCSSRVSLIVLSDTSCTVSKRGQFPPTGIDRVTSAPCCRSLLSPASLLRDVSRRLSVRHNVADYNVRRPDHEHVR